MPQKNCPYCKILPLGPRGRTCERNPICMLKHSRAVSKRLYREKGREYHLRQKRKLSGFPQIIPGGGVVVANISKLSIDNKS